MDDKLKKIGGFVERKINLIKNTSNDSLVKAMLANLRRGVGRKPGSMPEIWDLTLEGLPEEFMSKDGFPTKEEWAVHIALTLFALHQQGRNIKTESMNNRDISFGKAVRSLAADEADIPRVKRRFDAALKADDIEGLAYYTRSLIQLLKSNDTSFNYPMLAKDLYLFQTNDKDVVRLSWGQDFYRRYDAKTDEKIDGGNEK